MGRARRAGQRAACAAFLPWLIPFVCLGLIVAEGGAEWLGVAIPAPDFCKILRETYWRYVIPITYPLNHRSG